MICLIKIKAFALQVILILCCWFWGRALHSVLYAAGLSSTQLLAGTSLRWRSYSVPHRGNRWSHIIIT